jgi:hypothetical protein
VAKIRVPRKGVTQAELASVLSRRLGGKFEVAPSGERMVVARRNPLSAVAVRITSVPGATVFRIRGVGIPVVSLGAARIVADAIRRSPEFRSI